MNEEILRIQKMVAEGKVTPEEAAELLESVGVEPPEPPKPVDEKQGEEPKGQGHENARKLAVIGMISGAAIAVGVPFMLIGFGGDSASPGIQASVVFGTILGVGGGAAVAIVACYCGIVAPMKARRSPQEIAAELQKKRLDERKDMGVIGAILGAGIAIATPLIILHHAGIFWASLLSAVVTGLGGAAVAGLAIYMTLRGGTEQER
jgi:SHOCT-like domain